MENFTVPDFISTNTLKDLSSKIRANKRERISEYLEEKKQKTRGLAAGQYH